MAKNNGGTSTGKDGQNTQVTPEVTKVEETAKTGTTKTEATPVVDKAETVVKNEHIKRIDVLIDTSGIHVYGGGKKEIVGPTFDPTPMSYIEAKELLSAGVTLRMRLTTGATAQLTEKTLAKTFEVQPKKK